MEVDGTIKFKQMQRRIGSSFIMIFKGPQTGQKSKSECHCASWIKRGGEHLNLRFKNGELKFFAPVEYVYGEEGGCEASLSHFYIEPLSTLASCNSN